MFWDTGDHHCPSHHARKSWWQASVLIRLLRRKTVKHDSIADGTLDKFGHYLAAIRAFVHINLDRPFHSIKLLPCIVEVVPGRSILHTADECGPFAFEVKLAGVKRMFGG